MLKNQKTLKFEGRQETLPAYCIAYLVDDVVAGHFMGNLEQVVEGGHAGGDELIPATGVVAVTADAIHLRERRLTHLCPPLRSTFAVRETASLGIMRAGFKITDSECLLKMILISNDFI